MAKVTPTDEQLEAMRPSGHSLLVSAGAGSGKTWVLTHRILRAIAPEEEDTTPADITDFLVITYTRAAAAELKGRITNGLAELTADVGTQPEPDRKRLAHLRRQAALVGKAQISTIHAFCSDFLREFGMEAGVRPDFRIIEDEQADRMKRIALNRVLEMRYAEPDRFPGFQELTETLGRGRDDRGLIQMTLEVSEKLQCHVYPEQWASKQKKLLEKEYGDLSESPWGKEMLEHLLPELRTWTEKMQGALEEIQAEDGPVCANYRESFATTLGGLKILSDAAELSSGSWEKIREALDMLEYPRLGTKKVTDSLFRDRMKAVREKAKKYTDNLRKVFAADPQRLLADIRDTAPALNALTDLALDYRKEYDREKRRSAYMDFSDLEHVAARLLIDPEGMPTALAATVARRYREILVDEYQDVSPIQEELFKAIAREGKNLVMVGDIKQSIYRFRLADPSIFNGKYKSFRHYREASDGEPKMIPMKKNYRSRSEIIAAVNSIFCSCMSPELGDVDYRRPDQQLNAAASYEGTGEKPQLVMIQPPSAEIRRETGSSMRDCEAAWVASEIRRLVDSRKTVKDDKGTRPIRWSDVAVLLRSYKNSEPVYRREMEQRGIPVLSSAGTDLYAEPETAFLMNMLSIVDNPHKDVPLMAVLRSPAFGFTADELAAVRIRDKTGDLFDALQAAAEADEKSAAFLRTLTTSREAVPGTSVSELVWQIICRQDLLSICSAMEDGQQRQERILGFLDLCGKFETDGGRGLHSLLAWLERMNEKGLIPETVSGRSDGVTILSVHRSKGLEFPVVFVCGTGSAFNNRDMAGGVLTDPKLGLGCRKTDRERKIVYPTLAYRVIAEKLKRENRSEEMRLMYVALTRAREILIVTGTVSDADKMQREAEASLEGGVPDPAFLADAGSALKWFAAAAAADKGRTFSLRTVMAGEQEEPEQAEEGKRDNLVDEQEVRRMETLLKSNCDMKYPFAEATRLPSKITATELKGNREQEEEEGQDLISIPPDPEYSFPLPEFSPGKTSLTAAQRGTATHTLLQHLDWSRVSDVESIRMAIETAKTSGFLTEEEASAVDPVPILRLAESAIGKRMAEAYKKGTLRREFRFSLLTDAEKLFPGTAGEQVLLQGVVDCFFEESGKLVLIDYKTDRVFREEAILERAEFYRGQLDAYAAALSRITGKTVAERILVFLASGREIRV